MARGVSLFAGSLLLGLSLAQSLGSSGDNHPKLDTWQCTRLGGCVKKNTALVIDASAHWIHQKNDTSLGCGNWGSAPNSTVCPTELACYENCVIEGISNYTNNGVNTSGASLYMRQLSSTGATLSPRLYLLAENEKEYEMLHLTGNELAFDVDVSKLPCGMNGALYLTEMSETGGQGPLNPGGAAYGQGYCDAQCFTYPFIDGVGNIAGKGACCNEMDIWEANKEATALTPHSCNVTGLYECSGSLCSFDGVCDQWGCSDNPYVLGNHGYYGPGLTVDTSRPFTVVTQFPTFPNGTLQEIRRLYVQDEKIIVNAAVNMTGEVPYNYIDTAYCEAHSGGSRFLDLGGMPAIGDALSRGMVLIFSIWWDTSANMTWLDSGSSGPCTADEGNPSVIAAEQPDTAVTWSNIKWGEINSTYKATGKKC